MHTDPHLGDDVCDSALVTTLAVCLMHRGVWWNISEDVCKPNGAGAGAGVVVVVGCGGW